MKNPTLLLLALSLQSVSLYSITFFNLTSGTLELHVRTQRLDDDRAMHAVLGPHSHVTWQAPYAPSMQLTIAVQQRTTMPTVKSRESFTVQAQKASAVASFSPWQKTTTLTIKPAGYSRRGVLSTTDCVLIRQETPDRVTAITVDKYMGLVALRNYSTRIAMRFKLKKNEIRQ